MGKFDQYKAFILYFKLNSKCRPLGDVSISKGPQSFFQVQ